MNKVDRVLKSTDSFLDKFEKFAEVYLIIAFVSVFISFLYNIIIRSL